MYNVRIQGTNILLFTKTQPNKFHTTQIAKYGAGALLWLTAALETSRDAAHEAATVITTLLNRHMPADTKAKLCQQLRQMQAVPRLSHLLCPQFVSSAAFHDSSGWLCVATCVLPGATCSQQSWHSLALPVQNLACCIADKFSPLITRAVRPALAAKFSWPAKPKPEIQPAELQKQCDEVHDIATTMLTILESDSAHTLPDIHPVLYQWKPCALVWAMPSHKAWNSLIAIAARAVSTLQWADCPDVATIHREHLDEGALCDVSLQRRIQETVLKLLDQLLRGKQANCATPSIRSQHKECGLTYAFQVSQALSSHCKQGSLLWHQRKRIKHNLVVIILWCASAYPQIACVHQLLPSSHFAGDAKGFVGFNVHALIVCCLLLAA